MIKRIVPFVALCLVCLVWFLSTTRARELSQTPGPQLQTDDQKTFYALGLILGRNVAPFKLTAEELAIVQAGLRDAVTDAKPQVDLNTYGPKVNDLAQKRAAAQAEDEKKKGTEFLDGVAKQQGATKTPSGIVMRVIKPGEGDSPAATDVVKVHYEGKLPDGTIFDSSIQRGQPAEFPLNRVIPCWTEALQKMKKGEKAQIVCPAAVAYGDRGSPPLISPGATLSFEVELLDFHKP